ATIHAEDRALVEASAIGVWNVSGTVALLVAAALRARAKLFIGPQEVSELIDRLEKAYPALVKELIPKVAGVQTLVNVLRRLGDENVCIRDLKTIVEAVGEFGTTEADPLWLAERVRSRLSAQLAYSYAGLENRMPAVMLDPLIEDTLRAAIHDSP